MNQRLISWAFSLSVHAIALSTLWWLSTSMEPPVRIDLVHLELHRNEPAQSVGMVQTSKLEAVTPAAADPPRDAPSPPPPAPPPQPVSPPEPPVERPVPVQKVPKPVPPPKPKPAPKPVAKPAPLPEPAPARQPAVLPVDDPVPTTSGPTGPSETADVKAAGAPPVATAPATKAVAAEGVNGGTADRVATARERYLKEHFTYIRDRVTENVSYPMIARRKGWAGQVVVSFVIFLDGNVEDLKVVSSSGYGILDRCALDAVTKSCPFPAPPTRAEITLPIRFQLN